MDVRQAQAAVAAEILCKALLKKLLRLYDCVFCAKNCNEKA